MTNADRARLALENIVLLLNRPQPNTQAALTEAVKALELLGGIYR